MCVPYLLLLRVPIPLPPCSRAPSTRHIQRLLPSSRSDAHPSPRPWPHCRQTTSYAAHLTHFTICSFLLLTLVPYLLFLSFPLFLPLSFSLSFLFFYTRASHIADSSHTVAEVGGLRACGALRDLRGSSFFVGRLHGSWRKETVQVHLSRNISDVRVVGIAMIIRDQFTCQSSTIDQLITVRRGM